MCVNGTEVFGLCISARKMISWWRRPRGKRHFVLMLILFVHVSSFATGLGWKWMGVI